MKAKVFPDAGSKQVEKGQKDDDYSAQKRARILSYVDILTRRSINTRSASELYLKNLIQDSPDIAQLGSVRYQLALILPHGRYTSKFPSQVPT